MPKPKLKLALVSLSLLFVSGAYSGALADKTCGCDAECSDGYVYHAIGKKCLDGNVCRIHAPDNDCTVVCSKKDDEKTKETKPGNCHNVYHRTIGLKRSPRADR